MIDPKIMTSASKIITNDPKIVTSDVNYDKGPQSYDKWPENYAFIRQSSRMQFPSTKIKPAAIWFIINIIQK